MLTQMGLKADQVDDEHKKVIQEMIGVKTGDRKKVVKKSKENDAKQKRLANLNEGDIMAALDDGGANKLSLGDLF